MKKQILRAFKFYRKLSALKKTLVPQNSEFETIIGAALTVSGEIKSTQAVCIYGDFSGKILANKILVARGGSLRGEIYCKQFYVEGNFSGEGVCEELTTSYGAVMNGNVYCELHTMNFCKAFSLD